MLRTVGIMEHYGTCGIRAVCNMMHYGTCGIVDQGYVSSLETLVQHPRCQNSEKQSPGNSSVPYIYYIVQTRFQVNNVGSRGARC